MFESEKELREWGKSINLSEQAILVIKNIRESDPARRVRSGPFNVSGRFARSRKMNHTIQHESRTVEFPALLMMELDYLYQDDDVIEIWDQPSSFIVNYKDANGRNLGHKYTADFFVLRRNSAGWEEWKLEEKLQKEFGKNPEKYYRDEEGNWHFPPGERYASSFELYFHVHSSSDINWVLFRNLKLLLPYYNSSFEISSPVHLEIESLIKSTPAITLFELREEIEEASNTHVFQLLLTKNIFIDLREGWLGDEKHVRLFESKEIYDFFVELNSEQPVSTGNFTIRVADILPGTTVRWNELALEIVLIGETEIMLRSGENNYQTFPHKIFEQLIEEGSITGVHFRPIVDKGSEAYHIIQQLGTRAALAEALHRFGIIKPAFKGEEITDKVNTSKTHRNWIKAYERSERKYKNGLLGLIPQHHQKGNKTDRLENSCQGLRKKMVDFIATKYENPINKTKSLAYGEFCVQCETEGVQPPSLKTFIEEIKLRATAEQTEKMQGKKVAYQEEEFNDWFNGIPLHGDRPWEYAHIDHTQVDLEMKHSEKDIEMIPAWVSIMFDSNPRDVLAYYLTFDKPSYRSCMCLIRECVRRHGRLPECFIVDNGPEFHSVYFEKLLARYKCDVIWRPPTKPRYGSIIERFIHTFNKQLIHNLVGNRKMLKNVRQMTKEVDPKRTAKWNLPLLDLSLDEYFYNEYPNQSHSTLGQTPNQARAEGMLKFPIPTPELIAYDDEFLIETMPSTRKGTAKLIRSRGIKFNGYFYRSKRLRRPELYSKQLEIRYDPFSHAHIYVLVGNEWVECLAPPEVYAGLKNKTERQVKIIAEEHRELERVLGRRYKGRLIELAKNHERRESSGELEKQRLRDEEVRKSAEQRGIKLSPGRSHLTSFIIFPEEVFEAEQNGETGNEFVSKVQLKPFSRALKRIEND